jgi:site-specific recombinase XerD
VFLSKSSSGIYYLFFFDDLGVRHKVSTRTRRKSEALQFLRAFRIEERERRERSKRISLLQFSEDFLRYSESVHTRKTRAHFEVAFRQLLRHVGDQPLHKITIRGIELFLSEKKADASDWTARKYYIALSSAFETAKRWNLLAVNPFKRVEKPRVAELRPMFIKPNEFQHLLSVVDNDDMRDLYVCAVCTGMRSGELRSLHWDNVDVSRGVINVVNSDSFTTQNRKNRSVPMNETLRGLFSERKLKSHCELVFPGQRGQLSEDNVCKVFKRYVRRARLDDRLHLHSIRYTFATWLVQAGVSLYEVQKLLGHSSISTTQIYAHLAASELHGAVNRISLDMKGIETPKEEVRQKGQM